MATYSVVLHPGLDEGIPSISDRTPEATPPSNAGSAGAGAGVGVGGAAIGAGVGSAEGAADTGVVATGKKPCAGRGVGCAGTGIGWAGTGGSVSSVARIRTPGATAGVI